MVLGVDQSKEDISDCKDLRAMAIKFWLMLTVTAQHSPYLQSLVAVRRWSCIAG